MSDGIYLCMQERFARLWGAGRLIVEDPNTLDVINNKTSFRELLMTYTHRMKKVSYHPFTYIKQLHESSHQSHSQIHNLVSL